MRFIYRQFIALGVAIGLSGSVAFAQLSEGGTPYSFTHNVQQKSSLPAINLMKPDVEALSTMDAVNDALGKPNRVGFNIPVNYNVNNSGTWETTPDGGHLWRLRLHADDALALSLYYHNFFIPAGGKVYIYNEYENHVIGAFTSAYNFENTIRATQMIQGSTMTIEYYAPIGTVGMPIIEIKEVVYFYRGVEDFLKPIVDEATGGNAPANLLKAQSCQVDVVCTPESTGWQDQINSVVHYTFSQGGGTYVCSASMVNNTNQDCTPYILSAWHCGEPNAGSNIGTWVWYWNYQKTTCAPNNNGTNPSKGTQTMTGGTVRASSGNGTLNNPPGSNQLAGSDFYLVELSSQPPVAYNAYYAGWDRTNTAATSGKGIHHPAGSAKKISTYTSTLVSASYNGGPANTHWRVVWAATTNGHGVTEGGSSGSPIFDQNGRVVGQLSGGSSYCNATTSPDLYGKMFTNWDLNGTTNSSRLRPWLDPANTGVNFIDGAYQPCTSTNPPTCAINTSSTSITAGSSVNFSDGSSGAPTVWSWNFDVGGLGGVAPAASSVQNPGSVTFSNTGTYQVQLIASNANGTCTTSVNINVVASSGCDVRVNIQDTSNLILYQADADPANGYASGTNFYGDLAKAERYANYAPFTHLTATDIFLAAVVVGGNGIFTINVHDEVAGLPGTVLGSVSYQLSTINSVLTGGQGLVTFAFPSPIAVNGNPFYISVDLSGLTATDELAIVTKQANVNVPTNTGYEQWSDGTWHDMTEYWTGDWSFYITANLTDAPVSANVTASQTTACVGSSITFNSNATNATGYEWYTTGGTPATATTANTTVTYSTPGTYTAYLVAAGACDGNYIDSVQVTISSGFTVNPNITQPTCAGNDGAISISVSGSAGPFNYSIDNGTSFQPTNTFSGLSPGTYSIVVNAANGCSGTASATLNPSAVAPTVSTTTTSPGCGVSDGSITASATGGATPYQYSINGGAFGTNNVFTGLAAGSYTIMVEDNNGCQGTTSVSLSSAGGPVVSATSTAVSCLNGNNGSVTISATGGTAPYSYSIDGTNFVSTATFSNLTAGTYTVYVEDNASCTGSSSVTVSQPTTGVTHTANVTNASCGNSNGTISVTATGGATPYAYSLNGGAPQPSGNFTALAAGSYTVQVTDNNGCTSTLSNHTITGGTAMAANATSTNETCLDANGSITVTATGGTTPYQFSINGGSTFQANGNFANLGAGSYNIVVQDGNGCSANTTAGITNTGGFTLTITGNQTICFGNSATITSGGAGVGGSYSWDNGLGTGSTHTVSPSATTSYTVIAQDAAGCTETGTTTITVQTIPSVTVTPTSPTVCSGNSITLTADGAQSYVWNTGASTPSITVTPTSQTTYTVIGQNGSCSGSPVQTTVQVSTSPTVVAGSDVTSIAVGGTVNFNNFGSVATSYSWDFGDGQSSSQGIVSHTYNVPGTYTVVLTGTIGDCSETSTLTIQVGPLRVDQLSLENSISVYPNPSNGQFTLKIDLIESQIINVELYNTIGQIITTRSVNHTTSSVLNFDITNEANGFYFIKLTTKEGIVTKRITVTK
jgi:PKD repeat protein